MPSLIIPDELVKNVRDGNCVLFMGSDLALGFEQRTAPPCRTELARALAPQYNLSEPFEFPLIAQDFELNNGRQALLSLVREQVDQPRYGIPELYRRLAALPFTAYVTTCFDELLERAIRDAGGRPFKVVQDFDVAYQKPGRQVVLKLHGDVTRLESLTLTEDDYIALGRRLKRVLDQARLWFVMRPMLYLGYYPGDHYLKELYAEATFGMGDHTHRAYIVWSSGESQAIRYWERKNAQVIGAEAMEFVTQLENELRRYPLYQMRGKQKATLKLPYKFLDFYEPTDKDIYFGRDTETQVFWQLVLTHPLMVLFGPSGAGKTSLLRAGIMPRLWEAEYETLSVRAFENPLAAIRREMSENFGSKGTDGEPKPEESLAEFWIMSH